MGGLWAGYTRVWQVPLRDDAKAVHQGWSPIARRRALPHPVERQESRESHRSESRRGRFVARGIPVLASAERAVKASNGLNERPADDAGVDRKGTETRKHRKKVARLRPMLLADACAIEGDSGPATMDGIEVRVSDERTHRPFEV